MTVDDVLNIPLSKCYLDTIAYNAIVGEAISTEHFYRIQHINAVPPCRVYGKRNGHVSLTVPKRTYDILARYLSKEKLTVGDVLTIPRLKAVPRCGEQTARGIYYAFRYLSSWMSRFGIVLDVPCWETELTL